MRRLAILALALPLAACAGPRPGPAEFEFAAERYPAVIETTRDTLRRYGFEIDRVDARAGVVTSLPKPSAGLATPWDADQSSLGQEWEDLINWQQRRVRVTFEPRAPMEDPITDISTFEGPIVARVGVVIDRLERPGWRPDSTAPRLTPLTVDPALGARDMLPSYAVPFAEDPDLAARIADSIHGAIQPEAPDVPN